MSLDPDSKTCNWRDLTVALVQLPLPDTDEGTAAANVPLAAGCLRAFLGGPRGA